MTLKQNRQTKGQRAPWDVWVVGSLCFVGAALYILGGLPRIFMSSCPHEVERNYVTLFGILSPSSPFWIGICYLVHAVFEVAEGYGLVRGRSYGWWLMIIGLFDRVALTIVQFPSSAYWGLLRLLLICVLLGWAIFRIRFYRPFEKFVKRQEKPRSESD